MVAEFLVGETGMNSAETMTHAFVFAIDSITCVSARAGALAYCAGPCSCAAAAGGGLDEASELDDNTVL